MKLTVYWAQGINVDQINYTICKRNRRESN